MAIETNTQKTNETSINPTEETTMTNVTPLEATNEEKNMPQETVPIIYTDPIKAHENALKAALNELSKNSNSESELNAIITNKQNLIEDESENFTYGDFLSWLMHIFAYMHTYKFSPYDASDLLDDSYPYYCSVDEAIELEINSSSYLRLSKKDFEVIGSSQINYKTGDVATFSVVMNNVRKAQFSVLTPK
mgnify:CR=1 FL=1